MGAKLKIFPIYRRQVLGPTKVSEARKKAPNSIRANFGDRRNDSWNACHGSDSSESAEREIEIIFPQILKHSEESETNTGSPLIRRIYL